MSLNFINSALRRRGSSRIGFNLYKIAAPEIKVSGATPVILYCDILSHAYGILYDSPLL